MDTTTENSPQIYETQQGLCNPGAAVDRGNEEQRFLDVTKLERISDEENQAICLKVCNIVTKHGAYRLTLPVKTWQANIAILSALENMEKEIERLKGN